MARLGFFLNPIATISEVYRDLVLLGEIKHWLEWGVTTMVSVIVFYLGRKLYEKLRSAFGDVL